MEKIKTCCVTGHRDIPAEWADIIQKYLRMEIIAAVEDGYTHFISGFAAGADLLFAEIVAELEQAIEKGTLAALCESASSIACMARPRRQEIFACFDRYRSLKM